MVKCSKNLYSKIFNFEKENTKNSVREVTIFRLSFLVFKILEHLLYTDHSVQIVMIITVPSHHFLVPVSQPVCYHIVLVAPG